MAKANFLLMDEPFQKSSITNNQETGTFGGNYGLGTGSRGTSADPYGMQTGIPSLNKGVSYPLYGAGGMQRS
jgi:hypothetical protein